MKTISNKQLEYYKKKYQQHGASVRTLTWNTLVSQQHRFDILVSIGDLQDCSILDVGCGFGDLYKYLKNKNISISDYVGCDIIKEFINHAKEIYPTTTFLCMDFLNNSRYIDKKFDFVFASGLFAHKEEKWDEYLLNMTKKMFNFCNIGIAVNFLSNFSTNKDNFPYYADPSDVLRVLMKNISNKVTLRHDYRHNDFTVFLYKEYI